MALQFPSTHPLVVAQTQVTLPQGSFIRALPFLADETQRFRVDALVFCADIVAVAYIQIVQLAERSLSLGSEQKTGLGLDDIAMFQQAWSIVDQVYALRQILSSLKFDLPEVGNFMEATASAYELRNRMDHLDQRIPNIASSKDKKRGLLGSLSHVVQRTVTGSQEAEQFLVLQQAEPIRPGEQVAAVRIPSEIRGPIGNFELHVAGECLDLDATILTLGPVMSRVNDGLERSIRTQAAEKATELGVAEADLLAHFGAGIKVFLPFQIQDPFETPAPAIGDPAA